MKLYSFSAANAGDYQVVVTTPYGSVTSAVASLTVVPPSTQNTAIVMSLPAVVGGNLVLGFSLSQTSIPSFSLLEAPSLPGSWTTNTAAVLTTNAQAGGFQFTIPTPGSVEFFQVRSP